MGRERTYFAFRARLFAFLNNVTVIAVALHLWLRKIFNNIFAPLASALHLWLLLCTSGYCFAPLALALHLWLSLCTSGSRFAPLAPALHLSRFAPLAPALHLSRFAPLAPALHLWLRRIFNSIFAPLALRKIKYFGQSHCNAPLALGI